MLLSYRFCPTRWVEDRVVADRAVEVWSSIVSSIKYWEGLCKSKRPANKSYEFLASNYTDILIPVKLNFFSFIAGIFEPYLKVFQTDAPMVPFMYDELEKVLMKFLGLIYKKRALSEKIQNILKKEWLEDKEKLLDVKQINIGSAAQTALGKASVKSEKKRQLLLDCRIVIKTIILNLIEKTPLKYNLVKVASCLAPKNIVQNCDISSNRFRIMVDGLCALKKISSKVADNAKFQFNEMQKVVSEKYFDEFIKFDYTNDRLDDFLGKYFSEKNDLWRVCKAVFILSHGQSFVERGFSVNKELVDSNMKEKSLIAQRIIHDKIASEGGKISEFDISPDLRKSCMLASQHYKQDLKDQREQKISSEKSLKRKAKSDELENLKRRKADLQNTIKNLRNSFESETLKADKEQNVDGFTKAASFLKSVLEKEKTLKDIDNAQENVEKELKNM